MSSNAIIEAILAKTCLAVLTKSLESDSTVRQTIRLKNFGLNFYQNFVDEFDANKDRLGIADVALRIPYAATDISCPDHYRVPEDGTITLARNDESIRTLLYLEVVEGSDAQSTKDFFTIRDSDFLSESFNPDGMASTVDLLVRSSFEEMDDDHAAKPMLSQSIAAFFQKLINANLLGVSVIKVGRFVFECCKQLALAKDKALDQDQIKKIIASNFPYIELFSDNAWSDKESTIISRLKINRLYAELAKSETQDMDIDKVIEVLDKVVFTQDDGAPYDAAEQLKWHEACKRYIYDPSVDNRLEIPFEIFDQIFNIKAKGLKLGDEVQAEIISSDANRLTEYLDLNVLDGLNSRSRDAAIVFLEEVPSDEELKPLSQIITKSTRKKVERLAAPKSQLFENPLIQIAKYLSLYSDGLKPDRAYRLSITLKDQCAEDSGLLRLFSFLYGRVLNELASSSEEENALVNLLIDDELLTIHDYPSHDVDDESIDTTKFWDALNFKFELSEVIDQKSELIEEGFYSWSPNAEDLPFLVMWWGLVFDEAYREEIYRLDFPKEMSIGVLKQTLLDLNLNPSDLLFSALPSGALAQSEINEFKAARRSFLDEIFKNGLHHETMADYVDAAQSCLVSVKEICVPDDTWLAESYLPIGADIVWATADNAAFMLPTNVIKTRWLSKFFKECYELAKHTLKGNLPLNTENNLEYFNWVSNLTSSQQPAVLVSEKQKLYEASNAFGWGELYSLVQDSADEAQGVLDSPESILEEVASKIRQYIQHHPHKLDGLSLTVFSHKDVNFGTRLISLLRNKEFSELKVTLNLFTLEENFVSAMEYFEGIDSHNRFELENALFPPVDLRLYRISDDIDEMSKNLQGLETDIAIVPSLLEGVSEYQPQNKEDHLVGSMESIYDPLYDNPIHIGEGGRSSISVGLAPSALHSDLLIDLWNTITTRQKRLKPVNTTANGYDYYAKSVPFSRHANTFKLLHEYSHWLISVDRYLTREQIEGMENGPEIISFRDNIGPGGHYSIIVSSNSGKEFVLSRLQKKLKAIFNESKVAPQKPLSSIALSVYESAREVTPELALDALGVARVSEEILGLAVSKNYVDRELSSDPVVGFSAWVSLDSYKSWFMGGDAATRADMAKIIFDMTDGTLKVSVLILESKLRKDASFVSHAEAQVKATLDLFDQFLSPETKDINIDSQLWRNNLLKAIRNSNAKAVNYFGVEDVNGFNRKVSSDFKVGSFTLSWVKGLAFQSVTTGDFKNEIETSSIDKRIQKIKVGVPSMVSAFDASSIDSKNTPLKNDTESSKPEIIESPTIEKETEVENDQFQGDPNSQISVTSVKEGDSKVPDAGRSLDKEVPSNSDVYEVKRIAETELQAKYQDLINILSGRYGLPVKAVAWDEQAIVEGPSSILYRVGYSGSNPAEVRNKHDALKLDMALLEDQSISFSIGNGYINIDVPKKDDERYFVNTENLWVAYQPSSDELVVPLGIDRFGQVVDINFSNSDSPHLLVGGTTGSGKSEAMHTIICGMLKFYKSSEIDLMLIDPKGTEMAVYEGSQSVRYPMAMYEDEAKALLETAVNEMQSRFEKFKTMWTEKKVRAPDLKTYNQHADEPLRWLVVVIDEYADLMSDREYKKDVEMLVRRIAQKGRSAGIHLIIATQKPSAEVISTTLRSNLPAQIALRVKGYQESRVIIEEAGAEALIGKGDAIFKSQKSTSRVQCGKVDDISSVVDAQG